MQRAVVNLIFKNSDFEIMPRALNQWKRWVAARKLARRWANFTVNAMNHPLFWPFRKWRFQEEDARAKLAHMTKQDLVDKIVADEMAIGSAQSRLSRLDDAIEHMNIQRDNLL